MSIIRINDLVKVYSSNSIEVQALRGVSFEVEKSGLVSIMGPSGSGKSTLLNIIGAVDTPTAGTVEVNGQLINNLTEKERDLYRLTTIGYVFQELNLIPTLTAFENVQLPMIALDRTKSERRGRGQELLEMVGLADRFDHYPDQMSGGERQRVAIASALANDPPIILADEPTGVLDSVNAIQVLSYLRNAVEELDKTIIMVTHDPSMARRTDIIYRIRDGRIDSGSVPSKQEDVSTKNYDRALQERTVELKEELLILDNKGSKGEIRGSVYCEKRQRIVGMIEAFERELNRLGITGVQKKNV